jgi:hypothetical protein
LTRHLDDNPHNRRIENLAWGTHKDNKQDAIRNGIEGAGSPAKLKSAAANRGQKRPSVSFSNSIREVSPETCKKISLSLTGKKQSVETVAKRVAATKATKARRQGSGMLMVEKSGKGSSFKWL